MNQAFLRKSRSLPNIPHFSQLYFYKPNDKQTIRKYTNSTVNRERHPHTLQSFMHTCQLYMHSYQLFVSVANITEKRNLHSSCKNLVIWAWQELKHLLQGQMLWAERGIGRQHPVRNSSLYLGQLMIVFTEIFWNVQGNNKYYINFVHYECTWGKFWFWVED